MSEETKRKASGRLIIVGGKEDKEGDKVILEEISRAAGDGKLVVVTAASQEPEELEKRYRQVFRELGVKQLDVLDIRERHESEDAARLKKLEGAKVVFFTGGDQLRITSQIAGSPLYEQMCAILKDGGLIAGTSAGAAVMPTTMIVGGPSDETNTMSALSMAPGLGLVEGVIIDSHFAERGRMGRLLTAVVQNPANIGLGIDEDTAVVFEDEHCFRVLGSGAVYVVDGSEIGYSSLSEERPEGIISIHRAIVHVLGEGNGYDLAKKMPLVFERKSEE